ncbi:prenyltransferase [Enterococcus pseudoavium]|uniref:Prenyltransferase n=1 Tax=Enterococcus pseudoavium TaxID=44007 RepID=A0AAE4I4K8_9ENTE|nr:prenyltransferase [Enterococcus pseudoavium]MDT2737774.1 prenyltransferase [Enterococcus pseudoavium]
MHNEDIQAILAHRYDQGWDYWTTEDKRLSKGAPFSCLESAEYLLELGMDPQEDVLQKVAELLWESWREPGEFKLYPQGAVFPCQTIPAATLLVRLGHGADLRMKQTVEHLLATRYKDGGWWCKKFFFGKGAETEFSNPLPTLNALELFRRTTFVEEAELDDAVEFLLNHWETKLPLGPCHYGIGTLFMQVEYPFRGYGLFYYLYVLSFYEKARNDPRFQEAFMALKEKIVADQIVVERVVPKLRKLSFCRKNQPSELATQKYQEILTNLAL